MKLYIDLQNYCKKSLVELYGLNPETELSIQIEQTNPAFEGHLTLVVFPFLRYSKKRPEETASEIGNYLVQYVDFIDNFNVVKGFLNLVITNAFWVSEMIKLTNPDQPLSIANPEKRKILIEYSSPNTNKPLHLGHIRNNLIGHSVAEILKARGHEVFKANLINDRGIHICKSMLAWLKYGNGETPESTGLKGDHLIGKYYVKFDQEYKKEVEALVAGGLNEDEAKTKAPLLLEAQKMLKSWEKGDSNVREIWSKLNSWTYEGFDLTYGRMGVSFDKIYYESKTYLLGKAIVEEGLNKGVFFHKEDGSVWCDLSADGLDEKLLLRSDGTSVYMTQDLGTAQLKADDFQADQSIYIVGNEQDYHFNVLKLILKKLGKPFAESILHLSYGMVNLPEGKMKSREGTVVDADDLMDDMANTALSYMDEAGKISDFSEQEKQELAEQIGLGALKYFILKTDIKKNITFNPKESIDFQGHTGPFIQYTHARIKSILRKVNSEKVVPVKKVPEIEPVEEEILVKIYHYTKALADAECDYNPGILANYLFDLAKSFNRFYHESPILKEENEDIRLFRLNLILVVARILKEGMKLLGIDVPERM